MSNELDLQSYTILIIDDNPTNLGVITDYFEEYGFTTLISRNGKAGLEKVQYANPDLILLDVMMPGIDGFETCRRLKANPDTKDIPVIFITALNNSAEKVKGFAVGAVDYVTKPIQHTEVLARVMTHLRLQTLTQELQEKNEALSKLNADKDKFLSIVAHDLRNPFIPLLGNSYLLSTKASQLPAEEVEKMSETIHTSADRIYKLLESLLQWSRLRTEQMQSNPEPIGLKAFVEQNLAILSSQADSKNIKIQNTIDDTIQVYADEHMLSTVIRNLVSNAVKFTEGNQSVTISASPNHEVVNILVADEGIGISPENLNNLFKIDVHPSTPGTDQEKGSGLGLIVCKEMVEYNGGQIWVESKPNQGTTVNFTVPIAR